MRTVILVCSLLVAASAGAKSRGGPACIDSYGTVIDGISSPSACKKLGARWGKPGTRSVPKEDSGSRASRGSKSKSGKHKGSWFGRSNYANR